MEKQILDMLAANPLRAHKYIKKTGGWQELLEFVREMAIQNKMRLMVMPDYEYEARKWKIVANILRKGLVFSDHNHPYDPKDVKGLWEVIPHVRSAHTILRNGNEYVRSGSIVRLDKMKESDHKALKKLLDKYNRDQKKRAKQYGLGFQRIIDWLREHPEAYEIWNKQLEKRR
jgi:hypothetical protein